MHKISAHKKQKYENNRITYYFTCIFVTIGTVLVFYLLLQKTEKLNLFILILSIAGGGLPFGIIGVFIDYKISQFKLKTKAIKRLKEDV